MVYRQACRILLSGKENAMKWKTPKVVEIACGMEINCYAVAKV